MKILGKKNFRKFLQKRKKLLKKGYLIHAIEKNIYHFLLHEEWKSIVSYSPNFGTELRKVIETNLILN
jgi:hypothetical protein